MNRVYQRQENKISEGGQETSGKQDIRRTKTKKRMSFRIHSLFPLKVTDFH